MHVVLSWFRQRRRLQILRRPFPSGWEDVLQQNVWQFRGLNAREQDSLRRKLAIFLEEKHWEGCAGLKVTTPMRVTISAYAALLSLGWDDYHFEQLRSILLYPSLFIARRVVGPLQYEDLSEARSGEAHYLGTIILAWDEVVAAGKRPGRGNVVLHELAHHLDMLSGEEIDGTPPLSADAWDRWRDVLSQEHARLVTATELGEPTFLDPYGAEDLGEFFAVATESFFEFPRHFRRHHGDLYVAFQEFYCQDPAARPRYRQ